jgi:hypothetical protein
MLPVKAYNNHPFLNSPQGRSIRMQCELAEPAQRLRQLGIRNTIVFFGSARIPSPRTAEQQMESVASGPAAEAAARMREAKWAKKSSRYYRDARELAKQLGQWSMQIKKPGDRFAICSGGGPGIMEAANRGASDAGAPSVGLGISLPFEQGLNAYVDTRLGFEFHYFFIRKYWFLYPAKALIIFPGGFGTFDEFFEMLTLVQTGKINKPLSIILYGSEFWKKVVDFDALVDWGVIGEKDLNLFRRMDSVKKTRDYLIGELEKVQPRKRARKPGRR